MDSIEDSIEDSIGLLFLMANNQPTNPMTKPPSQALDRPGG